MSYVSGNVVDLTSNPVETFVFVCLRDGYNGAGRLIGRGTTYAGEGGGTSDLHYAAVSLLLRGGSGLHGSASIESAGPSPKSPTITGAVFVDRTIMTPVASSSIRFSGGHISCATHADFAFGTGDFTVEGWLNLFELPPLGGMAVIFDTRASAGDAGVVIWVADDGALCYGEAGGGGLVGDVNVGAFTAGAFYHVHVTRQGGNVTLRLNGTVVASGVDSNSKADQGCFVGVDFGGVYAGGLMGVMDDFRVTKGIARGHPLYQPMSNLSAVTHVAGQFHIDVGDDYPDGTLVQVVAYSTDYNQWNDMIHITETVV